MLHASPETGTVQQNDPWQTTHLRLFSPPNSRPELGNFTVTPLHRYAQRRQKIGKDCRYQRLPHRSGQSKLESPLKSGAGDDFGPRRQQRALLRVSCRNLAGFGQAAKRGSNLELNHNRGRQIARPLAFSAGSGSSKPEEWCPCLLNTVGGYVAQREIARFDIMAARHLCSVHSHTRVGLSPGVHCARAALY
ncbi:hypothetical protein VTK26DRAFT_1984 [Humicola hyalothermophila]